MSVSDILENYYLTGDDRVWESDKYLNINVVFPENHNWINISKKCIEMMKKIDKKISITIHGSINNGRTYQNFSKIPKNLPNNIASLRIKYCDVKKIPVLPDSIVTLQVSNCRVKKLPDTWPSNLELLDLSFNRIKECPKNLPVSLRKLHLKENPITEVPVLNQGLELCDLSYTDILHVGLVPLSLKKIIICGTDIID